MRAFCAWVAYLKAGNNLDGAEEPLRVYLTCYQALRTLNDPRAASVLETAHKLLLERAGNITDSAQRHMFLEIPYHREILAARDSTATSS